MSPRRAQSRRVNKHAKTLHCECEKSYTRADHFERHKRVCGHMSEFLAATEPAPSSPSNLRPFYCLCGAGYTAAHAFTRHCRRTGHDGDWLRSTYQPRGHQATSIVAGPHTYMDHPVVAAHIESPRLLQIPAFDNITHSLPQNELYADSLLDSSPSGSDKSGLDASVRGVQSSEMFHGLEVDNPVILDHERECAAPAKLLPAIASESSDLILARTSDRDEDQHLLTPEAPPILLTDVITTNPMNERYTDSLVARRSLESGNDSEASPYLPIDNVKADRSASNSVVGLLMDGVRPKPVVKDRASPKKTRYPSEDPPKKRASRYSPKKAFRLGSLHAPQEDCGGISKAYRYGKRVFKLVNNHKGKVYAMLAAILGVFAVANQGGHSLTAPAVTSSQDWIIDSIAPRHTAKDSSMFSNVHAVLKACPSAHRNAPCNYSGAVPLSFKNGKYLLLQDVLYRSQANTNVVSLMKLGEAGFGGEWTAGEVTIYSTTDMQFIGRALRSKYGYRLDDLVRPASTTQYPSIPTDIMGDGLRSDSTFSAKPLALRPTSVLETDWRRSGTDTTVYPPYMPLVGDSVVTIPSFLGTTTSDLALTTSSEAHQSVSSLFSRSKILDEIGPPYAAPSLTRPPTTTSHQYSLRGTKRPLPEDPDEVSGQPTKRVWPRKDRAHLDHITKAFEERIESASRWLDSWKYPHCPVTPSLSGTIRGGSTTDTEPVASLTTGIISNGQGKRFRSIAPLIVTSAIGTTTSSNPAPSLRDNHKADLKSSSGRTGGWQFPTWTTLRTGSHKPHRTQPQLSPIESPAPESNLSAAADQLASTVPSVSTTPSASALLQTTTTATTNTSVLMTAPTEFSHHSAHSPSPIAMTSTVTSPSSSNTSSADWTLPSFPNPFTWRPSPRINARDYALTKHSSAKKKAAEKRDELKQRLASIQKCPPSETCEPCERHVGDVKCGEGCWLF